MCGLGFLTRQVGHRLIIFNRRDRQYIRQSAMMRAMDLLRRQVIAEKSRLNRMFVRFFLAFTDENIMMKK